MFSLSPNRWYQFHSSIIRTHFRHIALTLNAIKMIFSWFFRYRRQCGFFLDDHCALRVASVHSPQSLSTIFFRPEWLWKRKFTEQWTFVVLTQINSRKDGRINWEVRGLAFTLFRRIVKQKDWDIQPGCLCWRLIFCFKK